MTDSQDDGSANTPHASIHSREQDKDESHLHALPLLSTSVSELDTIPSNFLPHDDFYQQHINYHHQHVHATHKDANDSSLSSTGASNRGNDAQNRHTLSLSIPQFSTTADTIPAFQCHALAGGFSLALSYGIVHPIDSLRVQLQASMSREKVNALMAVQRVLSNPVPVAHNLMRGFFASILGAFPQGALRFSTYEFVKCKLLKSQSEQALLTQDPRAYWSPLFTTAIAASCGDLISCIVKIPREIIAQRLQTKQFTHTSDVIKNVLATEGVLGLYRGITITCIRDLPFFFILFSSYESIKSMSNGLLRESWIASAAAGAVSGGLAGLISTPADCIKTRIMTQRHSNPSILSMTRSIINEHGASALMTGSVPRSFLWFGVCGVFFPTYELTKILMYEAYNHKSSHHEHQFDQMRSNVMSA